jgi:predicted dehydrogenase
MPHAMPPRIHRRRFLRAAASGGIALGALSSPAIGRGAGAAERFRVAVMGTNGRGSGLAQGFAALPDAEVAAVCDVDRRATEKAARVVEEAGGRRPEITGDFRRLLDDPSLEALIVAAPNHWHGPATILACAAGKHVYVEKPLSHNPREGELMVEAARKHGRTVQMGNQRRSWAAIIEGIEAVRGGIVGRAYYSRGWYANTRGPIGRGKEADVPSWLDYDLWQGPAPRRPYRDNVVHYNWHWRWHWGNGELGNNGVHALDLCRWGLAVEYPVRVSSGGGRYHFDDDQETPDTHLVTFDFAERKAITWEGMSCNPYRAGGGGFGASFLGEGGSVLVADDAWTVYDREGKEVKRSEGKRSDADHYRDFIACARSGKRPHSDVEGAHQSTLLCHLGNIAQRTGRTLHCDPANGRIRGDEDAMRLWSREYERGWEPQV